MANQQIVEFIKHSLAEGKSEAEILNSLRKVGWPEAEIQAAKTASAPLAVAPSVPVFQSPTPQSSVGLQAQVSSNISPVVGASQALKMAPIGPQAVKVTTKSSKKIWFIAVPIVIAFLLLAGGGVFAYQKALIFARAPFLPEEFLEKALSGVSGINNASYQFSVSFRGESRETDALPFTYADTRTEEEKNKYERDAKLVGYLGSVVSNIRYYTFSLDPLKTKEYPYSLLEIKNELNDNFYYSGLKYATPDDDLFKKIKYQRGSDTKSYSIAVTLESKEAIEYIKKAVKRSYLRNYDIVIEGQEIIINSGGDRLLFEFPFHLPDSPKPTLVEALEGLGQVAAFFSRETAITGKAQGSGGKDGEVKLSETNLSLNAAFGDSSYAFSADIITKDKTFYARLNKFPSLPFLSALFDPSLIKGKWVEITEKDIKDTLVDLPISEDLAKEETPETEKALEAYKKMLAIAKEEKLIKVNGLPTKEKVDGVVAFRYDLSLNRQALASVYRRYMEEVLPLIIPEGEKDSLSMSVDESVAEYLSGDEFKTIYDYLAKNNSLSVWFSREGYPVQATLRSRIVPSKNDSGGIFGALTDTTNTTASTSKKSTENQSQFVLETTFKLQNINKAVLPKVPTEFLSFEEAWKLLMGGPLGQSLEEARGKANDATIKTSLSGIQMVANLL